MSKKIGKNLMEFSDQWFRENYNLIRFRDSGHEKILLNNPTHPTLDLMQGGSLQIHLSFLQCMLYL